jgi:quercetin dioxygenase-like cupin family protein
MGMPNVTSWADAAPVEVMPGLTRRMLNETADMMVVEFRSGAKVRTPLHTHPSQQIGCVVSGEIEITIEDVTTTLGPGDTYAVAGGVEHGAYFVVESVVIDCFSPPREDYR